MHELGLSSTEIAKYLVMSQPAILKAAKRGALYCLKNEIELELLSVG